MIEASHGKFWITQASEELVEGLDMMWEFSGQVSESESESSAVCVYWLRCGTGMTRIGGSGLVSRSALVRIKS